MTRHPAFSYERVEYDGPVVLVFRLTGKLHGSPNAFEFLEDVRDDVRAGHRNVVIDLGGLTQMNSAGVGVIAACYTSLLNAKGTLAVSGVNDRLRMLMEVVCLWDMIAHHETEAEAVASFA
jgi:anti-sigma B factor antagonist